jgi:hypothetical protein
MAYIMRTGLQCIMRIVIIAGMHITGTITILIIVIIAITAIITTTGDPFIITGMVTGPFRADA